VSSAPRAFPSGGGGPLVLVGRAALRLMGWRMVGALPLLPRYILVVAPHTSNWDFFVGLAAKFALGLHAQWLGKHSLFRGPIGWMLRALGGIPVDRSKPDGVIEGVLAGMQDAPTFVLALAPEGTRKYIDHWKTGFHRIAVAAAVPVVPVAFDWSTRTIDLTQPPFSVTGDASADIAHLRALYRKEMARRPEYFADVRDVPLPPSRGRDPA
jgi:1-acyl-sn-glycerol-3-phosphate acyltransferase